MLKPFEKLKKLIEKGARNSSNDAKTIQSVHDHSVSLGATCAAMEEAAGFSTNDLMMLLNSAVRKQFKEQYPYAYVNDVFDDSVVFSSDYGSTSYRANYDVTEDGVVSLGDPVQVVRKVQYVEPSTNAIESQDIEIDGDLVPLVESSQLREAKTRMLKLIAPGWGSSGFYSSDVLKRDGPLVFKSGLHNFWDHPTPMEEKERPEGSLNRVASVLLEDAKWYDDYSGNGPGLYAKANVTTGFETAIDDLKSNIGMSIRASGKARLGEADGKKGNIIEAITNAKSVDYVTMPGAGGKVLDLFESFRKPVEIKELETMPPENTQFAELTERFNKLQENLLTKDVESFVGRQLGELKVNATVKGRITSAVLNEREYIVDGAIDAVKLTEAVTRATEAELNYLTSVGSFGKIQGFGSSKPTDTTTKVDSAADFEKFKESLSVLD